ncbi:MAG: iron-containing alcohol dehydrogenase [Eubacteriaceae bacterium]|nr:iron-containing alcohol dehydrogenase [Eubacteriaceae bacterium]
MRELCFLPEIQRFDSFGEFVRAHRAGDRDIILTDNSSLQNFRAEVPPGAAVVCIEKYGEGKVTDTGFEALRHDASKMWFDRVIAIGGGVCIDMAKMLCAAGEIRLDEIPDTDHFPFSHNKELIAIPTTCGSGSEAAESAVICRSGNGSKIWFTDHALRADYAVMIPSLLYSLPEAEFAGGCIDALIYAVESFSNMLQSTKSSRMLAEKALEIILLVFEHLCAEGMNARIKYIYFMQLASLYAGAAASIAPPSASHALGNQLMEKIDIPHAEACLSFLDAVLKKYLRDITGERVTEDQAAVWGDLMVIMAKGMDIEGADDEEIIESLNDLLNCIYRRSRSGERGLTKKECIRLGTDCWEQQQKLLSCSFSPFSKKELTAIYQSAWGCS